MPRTPNHVRCSHCFTETPELNCTPCIRASCNANYCKTCVENIHADYFHIPRPNGSESLARMNTRCKRCNIILTLAFFKSTKFLPITPANLITLTAERAGATINYMVDRIDSINTYFNLINERETRNYTRPINQSTPLNPPPPPPLYPPSTLYPSSTLHSSLPLIPPPLRRT